MNILDFKSVQKAYGAIRALRGISLEIERGSVVALLGPNGAGKSTLFGCLLGTILPDEGQIHFNDKSVTPSVRTCFGYLAERVALYQQRTIFENASFIARLKGMEPSVVTAALQRVGLYDLRDRKVSQLSKGQLQRAGLAIALAGDPELLVLDEPFNGLDPVVLEIFLETIREEQRRGATILLSTHTISAAEEIATHVAILLDGQIVFSGPLQRLRDQFPDRPLEAIYHRIAKGAARERQEVVA